LKIKRRKHEQNSQRQEELRKIDAWLEHLHREHPVFHWLLAIGIAVGVFSIAMFLKWLLMGFLVSERKAQPSIREREFSMSKDAFQTSGSSPTPDFLCENHGSIFLLRPISPAAFLWIDENLPADRQTFGNAVAVEHRCIWAILEGIQNEGLAVQA